MTPLRCPICFADMIEYSADEYQCPVCDAILIFNSESDVAQDRIKD